MLTLYGSKGSGSASIEAALAIAGVGYEHVDGAEWNRTEGYEQLKRINPLAQLPTLVLEDGTVLTESAAILIHLGLVLPESGLLAADPSRRAQQIRGLVYIVANCYAGIGILDYPERWYPDPDDAVRKAMERRGRARLHELWDLFVDQFPATPWLSGDRLGALDILAATVSMWSGSRKHLAASRPAFSALLARIEADPRIAPVWAKHWPPKP